MNDEILGVIETDDGTRYDVLETGDDREPIRVRATRPWERGGFAEAAFNLRLALRRVRVDLWLLLPARARRYVNRPKIWWAPARLSRFT